MEKLKVIDVHTHPYFDGANSKKIAKKAKVNFTIKGFITDLKKNNIVKAVLISDDFKAIYDVIDKYPKKFIGAPMIMPTKSLIKQLKEVKAGINKGYFGAIKILSGYYSSNPNDKKYYAFYKLAAKHKIPVIIHTGDTLGGFRARLKHAHPLNVDDVAVDFPNVNFIICHMGCPWFMDAAEVAYKNPNVWTDLSGIITYEADDDYKKTTARKLSEAINYAGPENILFGTDYPLISHKDMINFTKTLNITKAELKQILYTNSAKLFKLK